MGLRSVEQSEMLMVVYSVGSTVDEKAAEWEHETVVQTVAERADLMESKTAEHSAGP